MDAQKIAQRLYESFDSDDLCEHPEIVDAVEDLADEYEDLKSDNAKLTEKLRTRESENKDLRNQIGDADRINGRLAGENESLKAKNAALMELVQDMWHDGMCDCDEQYTCDECEYGYHERMRELGIEV